MLHRDFTARENPVQYKPIIAYSLGAIISIFGSYFLLVNFSSTPLEAIGTAYNFSYFITFLVLMIMFICDSKLKINQVLIIYLRFPVVFNSVGCNKLVFKTRCSFQGVAHFLLCLPNEGKMRESPILTTSACTTLPISMN